MLRKETQPPTGGPKPECTVPHLYCAPQPLIAGSFESLGMGVREGLTDRQRVNTSKRLYGAILRY